MFKNFIWIVDDNLLITETLKDTLKYDLKRPEEILVFHTGKEAMKCTLTPSIAFVDIVLPDVRGDEVIRFIENNYPFTPIISITAYYDPSNVKSVLLAGADEVIPKPLSPDVVRETIERAIMIREEKIKKYLTCPFETFKESIEKLILVKRKEEIFNELAVLLSNLIKCDRVSVMERKGDKMMVIASNGIDAEKFLGREYPVKESVSGYVSEGGYDYLHIGQDEKPEPVKPFLRDNVVDSLSASLFPDGRIVIFASMINTPFNQIQKNLFYFFTKLSGLILEEVEVEEKIVIAFARALNARDAYTYHHSVEVSTLSVKVGLALGLDNNQIRQLRIAGLLHDLGKISMENSILMKSGELTEDEFKKIKEHPIVGASFLDGIPGFELAREIILQHHERLNGKGYPRGLKGDEVLLEARILAVVDTFHATVSHRPYRPAKSVETAFKELREDNGLDQTVVETLIEVIKRERIKEATSP